MNAKKGQNVLSLDKLPHGPPSIYFLEMRMRNQSTGVVRMVKTR
jgi:hypothetical protein